MTRQIQPTTLLAIVTVHLDRTRTEDYSTFTKDA